METIIPITLIGYRMVTTVMALTTTNATVATPLPTTKKVLSGLPKSWKKPRFIGLAHDKFKAVIANKPGLDPTSTQLQQLEKDVVQYASTNMNAFASQAMKQLALYNFTKHLPPPVDKTENTTNVL